MNTQFGGGQITTSGNISNTLNGLNMPSMNFMSECSASAAPAPTVTTTVTTTTTTTTTPAVNVAGITVPGSKSDQRFHIAEWFPTETESHVIVLKLVGAVQGQVVTKAVTVQYKPVCETCGHVNKATNKFCTECGTGLVLYR